MKQILLTVLVAIAVISDAAVDFVQRRALSKRIEALEQFKSTTEDETLVITINPKYGEVVSVQNRSGAAVKIESFSAINENGEWIARWKAK